MTVATPVHDWASHRADASRALQPGTRLGHYDVTALIGEGGMEVYRARDTSLNRDVAIASA